MTTTDYTEAVRQTELKTSSHLRTDYRAQLDSIFRDQAYPGDLLRDALAELMVQAELKGRQEQYWTDLEAMRDYVPDVADRLEFRSKTNPWEYRTA